MASNELNQPPIAYVPEGAALTPYQKAREEWDNRIGTARVQAKNWRIMALALAGICALLTGGLIFQSAKSKVVPYVVQVNGDGLVQAAGPATRTNYTPSRAVLQYFLSQFVTYVRSVPLDPVVAKERWLSAYGYLRQSAANTLNEIAQKEQPLQKVGQETVSVQIKSVVPLSGDTYQVRWEENCFSKDGISSGARNMTGLFTVEISPPTEEAMLKQNPLGLYIRHFSWSQEAAK
ncbi:conjugal transfer protein TrbF [Geomonas paludis]|uniref:Conjugal transfer protein TrbF n=1 Tax=Geomonas paludis TaxID=2740185 RepID=A0A6V8MV55_9BACT|nr:conjugal transfer protein TrbF [Geomonas paludis]GFO63607.1 conjugal transfer protein TrbF [Geomonas paludis]